MRESSDCKQTPSSMASKSVSHVRSDAHSSTCEDGKTGDDDSLFVVIFCRACQPPSLRVSSIRLLLSNSLASHASSDRPFATLNETGIGAREIGIFPQPLRNIPRRKSRSAGLNPLSAALIMLACILRCADA
jgi:hypothetical protein